MFFDFDLGEEYKVIIENYLGNQLIQRQSLNAPSEILKAQFVGLMQQIMNEDKPYRVRMTVPEVIWDNYEKKQKVLTNYVEFKNKLFEK